MKKTKWIFLTVMIILITIAGGLVAIYNYRHNPDESSIGSDPTQNLVDDTDGTVPDTSGDEVFSGKIASILGNSILLMGTDGRGGSLYTQGLTSLVLIDSGGNTITAEDLKPGMTVDISYSGEVMESYPAQLAGTKTLQITGENDDILGFYMQLIRDIYDVDSGLNSGIEMIVLDLSEVENLTDAEKSALIYLMQNEYGYVTFEDTYDELVEKGLIVDSYFENGILISFTDMSFNRNSFTFSLTKWRSGLGAYYYIDCKAGKDADGDWTYEIGTMAIS